MAILTSWPYKLAIFAFLLLLRLALYFIEAPKRAPVRANSLRSQSRRDEESESVSGWAETLDSLLITIGLVFFVVQPFILQPFYIPSGSMENTLQWTPVQDRLLAARWIYRLRDPQRGDVVIFQPPRQAIQPGENTEDDYIKRCIGVPGDIVYATATRTYFRNGQKMNEPYVKWSENTAIDSFIYSYDMKIVDGNVYSREYVAEGERFGGDQGLWSYRPRANGNEILPRVIVPPEGQQRITNAKPEAVPDGMFLMLGDNRNNSSDGHVWGFVPRANLVGKAMCVFWPPRRLGTLDRMSGNASAPATPVDAPTSTRNSGVAPLAP